MTDLQRYALITTKMPREFLLLQGTGCRFRQCSFCDYYADAGDTPCDVNQPVLARVTGEYGVLDIINSGSAMELDEDTLTAIGQTVRQCGIHTLWFEAHWLYRRELAAFAARFPEVEVKFRLGAETFDGKLRESWHKGIPANVTAADMAAYFRGVCLLIGIKGQTFEQIERDVQLALANFEYCSINAFVENSTPLQRDNALVARFAAEILPHLQALERVEVLLNNTDLGVG